MKWMAISISVLWLLQVAQAEAACRTAAPSSTELPREDCRGRDSPEDSEIEMEQRLQACVLVRPVLESEKEQARTSIRDSNCFLRSVLRPEMTDAIKRGAEAYLAMRRSERTSEGPDKLILVISEAIDSTRPGGPSESGDAFILLLVFIERVNDFRGANPGPVSRVEDEGRRYGIYGPSELISWILSEYASSLTGSAELRAETRRMLKTQNLSSAPPKSYSAKGCKRRILYNWPTLSSPRESYNDLPGNPGGYGIGDYDVHWGVCPDDHSLWVYHYQRGWKKASMNEVVEMCRQPERRLLVGLECEALPQRNP